MYLLTMNSAIIAREKRIKEAEERRKRYIEQDQQEKDLNYHPIYYMGYLNKMKKKKWSIK